LLLVANESFARAEEDIKMMTGMAVSRSSQQRLVQRSEIEISEASGKIETLSIDGGKVRLRTPLGNKSEWKDYKAVSLQGQGSAAFFQENEQLIDWVNSQGKTSVITCLGDGHDGIWNLIQNLGEEYQRREVLDWYHLKENLYKIGGSQRIIKQVEKRLWSGEIDSALAELTAFQGSEVRRFCTYVNKHRSRIPDYGLYRELGICIGSGSVESLPIADWSQNENCGSSMESGKCTTIFTFALCLSQWENSLSISTHCTNGMLPSI
jgi:hypothetical protein